MVDHGKRRWALAIGAGMLAIVIAGCSSSGSSGKAATGGSTTTAGGGNTTATVGTGSANGTVSVDLVITGDTPATIKGSKGRCSLPTSLGSSYDFSGSDYPSLGAGGNFNVAGATTSGQITLPSSIKAIIKGSGFLATNLGPGLTISGDRKKVKIDADIGGRTASGTIVHERVKGTITCG